MNLKIAALILGIIALGLVGYLILANKGGAPVSKQTSEINFDFGDAPDGKDGQQFPSLLSSNGARTKKTDEVWLGQKVTIEKDSKQVNADEVDDGVRGTATSCRESTTYFFIRIKNPGQMTGTAYLNLYADWNKDGRWEGRDECAPEWIIQNFPVDLSKQTEEIAVYETTFTAGKNTDKIWYRGAVTLGEKMNETATGEFGSGEIEDFGPNELLPDEKYYNFYCQPDPLIISHGSSGNVQIVPDWGSEPIFGVAFGQNYKPKDDKRQVSLWNNRTYIYESTKKDVDPPKRSVPHFVDLRVRFGANGKEASIKKSCRVIVRHDEVPIRIPGGKSAPLPTETPVKTEEGGSNQTETHPIQEGAPAL